MDILQQILQARNPYAQIGSKIQQSVERRAGGAAPPPPSGPLGTPQEPQQEVPQQGQAQPEPQAPNQAITDINARIQENMKNSRQMQIQQRTQQRQDELRQMLNTTRERRNNQLEALSADNGNGLDIGKTQDQGHHAVTGENGRLDTSQLVDADGKGNLLIPDAAAAWQAMTQAAAADGVNLTIGNSYRTYERQVSLAEEKGLYSQGGLAATPGKSNHGWGTAVDVGEGAQREWLAQNGQRFGFHTIPREPWHWEYRG